MGNNSKWRELIYRGVESQTLDYKAAQNWHELNRNGKAKIARHIMALANTKGGNIVIGVSEDKAGNPNIFTGLTSDEVHSFDPSSVGPAINRFSDPTLDFEIIRPVIDGKHYVIFDVKPFQQLPHVCRDSCGTELHQGSFYVRTTDASSRPAFRSSEIHDIIQRALRNQRQALAEIFRGVLYESGNEFSGKKHYKYFEKIDESRNRAHHYFTPKIAREQLFLEMTVYPLEKIEKLELSTISHVLKTLPPEKKFCTNNSQIVQTKQGKLKFMELFTNGLLFWKETLPCLAPSRLAYNDLSTSVNTCMSTINQIFKSLSLSTEDLKITVRVTNCMNYELVAGDAAYYFCHVPTIEISESLLFSAPEKMTQRIFTLICERFNYTEELHNQ